MSFALRILRSSVLAFVFAVGAGIVRILLEARERRRGMRPHVVPFRGRSRAAPAH